MNHCVNDIAVQGATPLFFMDYLATGKLEPEIAEKVIEGLAEACKHNGCALIGGETAEMPGFYPDGEYDLAGFIVGVVERERIITGKTVEVGDVILGLPSNGLHTNGYSLARKLLFEVAQYTADSLRQRTQGQSRQRTDAHPQELLAGGEEVGRGGLRFRHGAHHRRRALPKTFRACCLEAWLPSSKPIPGRCLPIFEHLQQLGNVPQDEMFRTFNMGLGMLLVVPSKKFKKAQTVLERAGEKAYTVGRIVKGDRKVMYT